MKKDSIMNYLTRGALAAAGLLCVLHAPSITKWFPYLIGALMVITGADMGIEAYALMRKDIQDRASYGSRLTRGGLLTLLGIATLFMHDGEMPFIGVVWGFLGLLKGERGITAVVVSGIKSWKTWLKLGEALVGLVLSFILLFNPVDAIGHHIVLLGVEIMWYALFKMDVEKRPAKMKHVVNDHMDALSNAGKGE